MSSEIKQNSLKTSTCIALYINPLPLENKKEKKRKKGKPLQSLYVDWKLEYF